MLMVNDLKRKCELQMFLLTWLNTEIQADELT